MSMRLRAWLINTRVILIVLVILAVAVALELFKELVRSVPIRLTSNMFRQKYPTPSPTKVIN